MSDKLNKLIDEYCDTYEKLLLRITNCIEEKEDEAAFLCISSHIPLPAMYAVAYKTYKKDKYLDNFVRLCKFYGYLK